ncbi:unnamed protein product [Mytilus coruscus]|uniref:Mab-21-like HhH/H2TH-like domain-containing protein n=1 Tax=Mytilus coruscus TaxID=42192 RepID=A0A6J8F1B9_MYTCO|nr:unnamed protein product [Mytilus coruscus]
MSKTDKTLSLQFYQYLNNIIGSEDVVKTRRHIFYAIDCGNRDSSYIMISSGSKAEGLDFIDSDYDQMYLCVAYRVYNSTNDVSTSSKKIPIIMDSSDTKPGFTKLKMYIMSRVKGNKFCEIEEGKAYFSSKLFREHGMPNEMVIHGPCQSTIDGSYDFVHCFRCKEWIKQAEQWIYRPRSSWPDYKLVSSIVQYDSNKFVYKQYQTSLNYFKAGLHCNATSAWSLLASLSYKHKRFHECIDIVNYTLSKCTPDKIVLWQGVTLMEQTFFQKIKNIAGFLSTCKHFIIELLRFPSPFNLLPIELTSLIETDRGDVLIPPVVYLNTLAFLCSHHLKDYRGKQTALQDLELTIRERYLIVPNKTVLEVAKHCLSIVESTSIM